MAKQPIDLPRGIGKRHIRYAVLSSGEVEVEVVGMQGPGCKVATGAVLQALGGQQHTKPKDETPGIGVTR
jgi:hypothetical protein